MDEEYQKRYERWRNQIDRRAEYMENAAIDSANHALKALLFLNGGACIALLGFLASVFTAADLDTDRARLLIAIVSALIRFAFGAGFAVCASAIAYLTNSYYAQALMQPDAYPNRNWKCAWILNFVAAALGTVALGLFFCGVWLIQGAL